MQLTECRIRLCSGDPVRGIASITLDDQFVVKGIRVLSIKGRLMVCMPSRMGPDGKHRDVAHPINKEARLKFDDRVLEAYRQAVLGLNEIPESDERHREVVALGAAAES